MKRICAALTALAILTACGGGGGKSGSLLPTTGQPASAKTGTATFTLKIPSKSTMTKLRRRFYQSQATQGVAIDWISTTPKAPDYSAPVSATCPGTLPPGVTSCGLDPVDGGTDYSFQLQIPAGTYPNFTVTTFDAAPVSGGTFATSANELAQGQLAAPVVITAGASNTIENLTFYGIPASVSFVPGPAQSHVTTYGGNIAVIGNAPQTFFAQALDADGFAIDSTDGSAPTVTVAESSGDAPQHFTIASTSTPYEYVFTAVDASANATIDLSATPGGSGLKAYQTTAIVIPVQELWTTQEAGSNPNGIYGYALYPSGTPTGPIDGYADPISNPLCGGGSSMCNFFNAAIDPVSGTIYAAGETASLDPAIYAFTQGAGSTGLLAPASAVFTGTSSDTYNSVAIDANHHGFILDNVGGTETLEAYNASPSGWSFITSAPVAGATAIAVAPPNAPFAGSIYVAYDGGVYIYTLSGTTLSQAYDNTAAPINTTNKAIGFDTSGNLWTSDGSYVYKSTVSSGTSLVLDGSGSLNYPGTWGTSFGAASGSVMYFGEGTGLEFNFDAYTCSGSCVSISVSADVLPTKAGSFAAFVTP